MKSADQALADAEKAAKTVFTINVMRGSVVDLMSAIGVCIAQKQWRKSADGKVISLYVDLESNGIATIWQPEPGTGDLLTHDECKKAAGFVIKRIADHLFNLFVRFKS